MMRKEKALSILIALFLIYSVEAQEKMNVLFIIADDLNCYLGSYVHSLAKTPNIDRLAEEGLLFENAYCNFPVCGPSRASMMTGLYPDQNNVKGNAILIRVPEVPEGYFESLPVPAQNILTQRKEQIDLPDSLAVSAIQAYLATISFLDAQVGRVLDALEENGLKENTIVVFTSDHGYHMGEHGHYQKRTLFEYSARIPLIISYPGQGSRGRRTGSFVETDEIEFNINSSYYGQAKKLC